MRLKNLALPFLLLALPAYADKAVCNEAANKLKGTIPEWADTLREYGALDKNAMVKKMEVQLKSGDFLESFLKSCKSSYSKHSDVFKCFANSSEWTGSALCMHPDTNINKWNY